MVKSRYWTPPLALPRGGLTSPIPSSLATWPAEPLSAEGSILLNLEMTIYFGQWGSHWKWLIQEPGKSVQGSACLLLLWYQTGNVQRRGQDTPSAGSRGQFSMEQISEEGTDRDSAWENKFLLGKPSDLGSSVLPQQNWVSLTNTNSRSVCTVVKSHGFQSQVLPLTGCTRSGEWWLLCASVSLPTLLLRNCED